MATTQQNNPPTELSTAWIPLEGLTEQWGIFGAEATTAPAFQTTSLVFAALAREAEALAYRTNASHFARDVDVTDLEHCLNELVQAQTLWTEAICSLEQLLLSEWNTDTFRDAMFLLVRETMEQRLRVSLLIQEVEHEQLTAYHHAHPSSERSEGDDQSSQDTP